MKKRFLTTALAAVVAFSGASAFAGVLSADAAGLVNTDDGNNDWYDMISADNKISGDYKYAVNTDGTAVITEYLGHDEKVEVPAEIDGKKVASIAIGAFANCCIEESKDFDLKEVVLPETIEFIDRNAFYRCNALEKINIPENMTKISKETFGYCESLKEIDIPESIKELGEFAFMNCSNLEKADLPYGLEKIGSGAFYGCENLKELIVPTTVTEYGKDNDGWVTTGCENLEKFTIPSCLPEEAFFNKTSSDGTLSWNTQLCLDKVKELTVYDNIKNIPDVVVFNKDITIHCPKGSPMEAYAKEHGFKYDFIEDDENVTSDEDIVLASSDKEPELKGDMNGDGKLSSEDALDCLKHVVGVMEIDEVQKQAADMNGDGKINTLDALQILKIVVGVNE